MKKSKQEYQYEWQKKKREALTQEEKDKNNEKRRKDYEDNNNDDKKKEATLKVRKWRLKKQHGHLASILIYSDSNSSDFGNVELNKDGFLMTFNEKSKKNNSNYLNGGSYVFSSLIFDYLPSEKRFSLENHVFPKLAKQSLIISLIVDSESFDIGTPARLFDAREILKRKLND